MLEKCPKSTSKHLLTLFLNERLIASEIAGVTYKQAKQIGFFISPEVVEDHSILNKAPR